MESSDDALFDIERAKERRCGTCGVVRPLAMFYVAAEQRYTAQHGTRIKRPCRICARDRSLKWRAPRQAILDRMKTESGCVDCGIRNTEHPEIYDFDHRPNETKTKGVAHFLMSGTEEEMLAEVAKCDVVCANCHRIRTRGREATKFGRDSGPQNYPRKQAEQGMM